MAATGTINVGKRVSSMEVSPEFDGYSKVVIQVTDDLFYESGVSTGRTLELKCPWVSPHLQALWQISSRYSRLPVE